MKEYHKNPRTLTKKQFELLKRDLIELGDLSGIVFDVNSQEIIGGNQRSRVFDLKPEMITIAERFPTPTKTGTVALGYVDFQGERFNYREVNWTTRQCEKANIVANKAGGSWDMDKLANEFNVDDLLEWGFEKVELSIGGELLQGNTDADEIPDIPEHSKSKIGDLWNLGDHRLLCGDSSDKDNIARVMQSDFASCIFTDPPYGVSIGKKNVMLNSFQKAGSNLTDIVDDDLTPEELEKKLLPVFDLLKKSVMAEDCTLFVTAPQGGELGMMMMMMMQKSCLPVRHVLIWKKNCPTFSMGRLDYDYAHEPILLTWGKKHKRPMLGIHKTSVWEVDKPRANKEHPTMKPVELYTNAYLNNSDNGDIVFDPYCGSGTCIIAAEQTGRKGRGIEISPNYCDVILNRWSEFTGKDPVRDDGALWSEIKKQ